MSKFYKICQVHAPSGGISFVDDERYSVNAEAQALVDQLMNERKESDIWEHEGMFFPSYFVMCYREENGVLIVQHLENEQ